MYSNKSISLRSIVIADARDINGKTARQIREYAASKYPFPYDKREVDEALKTMVDDGIVVLKGRSYFVSPFFLHRASVNVKKGS